MEGSSSKGSSKRKPAFTMKIKVQSKKKQESESDNDDYDSDYSKRKPVLKGDNSDYSDAESIPDLPEGTVVVKPEPVKEKKIRFSGPEFSKVPENLDIVNCTSCGRQINPNVSGAAKRHPELKVLVCRKCYSYYRSGKIEQDEDGLDEQCRWCGEGGRLLGCDHCHNAFCKSCIIRNFSRAELTTVMADDGSKWKCYVCEPSKLKKLLRECDSLFKKIEKEKLKARTQSSIDLKKSSSNKPQKATGKSMSSKEHVTSKTHKKIVSFTNFKLGSSDVVNISTQLLGLSAGFHTMLEVLNVDLNTSGDVKNSSREANSKKDHGAKTLETGLKEFLRSLNTVLCDALKSKEKAPIENGETTEDESVLSNGHISLSDDDNSSDLSQQELKVGWKSTSECSQVKKGSKPEQRAFSKYRDGKKNQSKSPLRKESKMDTSVDNDVLSNEVCDVHNDDSDEFDVPITFGPADGAGDGHTVSKDQNIELESDKSESQTKDDSDGLKGSRPLSETENEAAQLELLKELAEEMCKEQKERREEKKNEEVESSIVPEKEGSKQQKDKKPVSGDIKDRSGDSSESDKHSSMDDSVSSSDLLMSSDSDFVQSWSMTKSREKGPRKSHKGTDEKLEKKKKKRKKLKKEIEERSSRKGKEEKKLTKKRSKATDSEDDLEKEISKLEEEPEMKKKKKAKNEKTDSEVDSNEDTKSKKEKKEASDEEKKGTKTRAKKKAETSSSDDDDDEVDDEVDEDDEDDVPKMKNGKNKAPESQNGKDLENEIAKKALMAELEDADTEGGDESGNNDTESDDDAKAKKKGAKKDKKPVKEEKNDDSDNENNSEDDDSDAVPNKRKRIRSKLLDAKLSDSESSSKDRKSKKKVKSEDSDSEEVVKKKSKKKSSGEDFDSGSSLGKKKKRGRRKKKQKKRGKKRKLTSDSESGISSSSESESDSDSEISMDTEEEERREKLKAERKAKRKAKGNKRRRIKEQKDSSDEKGKIETDSDIDGSDDDDDDGKSPDKSGRKNIRKIKSDKKLTDDTKRARKAEESRRKRVAERQKEFNHVVQITDEQTKCPITTQLILEMDKDKKDPLIEVNKKLVRKLKPHQVEAAQFMWDCLCETTERIKKKEGSGCILAHCMGLGKTLSVITFVHTMLSNEEKTTMRTCLIVCPLNTVINWRNEWTMWFDEKDQLDVYEISSVKQNWPRADYLKDWHEGGGIMIMGYEMYRNLTQSARIKNKKLKAIFQKTLVDPGPDLVVCDEGHILKNDSSAISQALNKVRTRRRVVLTGTPLQNNLLEYHCMASFVKPNLMGTRKEFLNRFVNPITNGQHSDSTAHDVKVMGRRAHVLHEMLAGCVQRRDYSALTKFLPPKFEYVISVRLSPVQIELYEKYLNLAGIGADGGPPNVIKGARLFSDYQNLMKIWTHPWVLKLAEIRADNKMKYDDSEDSFIDNSTDEEIASMTDNSEDSLMAVSKSDSEESEKAGPSSRSSRRSRRGKPPPEDSDKEEVVKDWKTRSRGGEDGDEMVDLDDGPKPVSNEWWAEYVKEEDQSNLDLSGKLILLFEILRMCEEIGDKVLVFSQSLLSLDIIEYFLDVIDKRAEEAAMQKEEDKLKGEKDKDKKDKDEKEKEEKDQNGDAKDKEDDTEEFVQTVFGKTWTKGADYFRMDGSTSPQLRSQWSEHFNDPDNFRARLFLISTKAGSLGINLVAANRVIIFDASWNPSHDIQSIFRVYRFGQTKPCYVYRFLAQGTMEEKIYERQVTKQSLSQRVVDEHQIDRHFTSADLSELYNFKPERLDDPNCPKTTHALPKDVLLAELLKHNKQIVRFHEHDSLLENREDQTLTEEEKKAAWEEYDNERKGISNRVAQASTASGVGMFSPDNVLQIVQMVKMRFPNLPPDLFQAQVQAILQQQILYQQSMQNQQIEQQRMMEMHRLQRIQNDIRSQQRQINDLTRNRMANPRFGGPMGSRMGIPFGMQHRPPNPPGALRSILTTPSGSSGKKDSSNARSTTPNNPPVVIDLSKS